MFNFKNLETYVARKNEWSAMFGKTTPLSLDNAADRQKIAQSIDSELSPEHLTCDGELSRAEVQKRYNFLMKAARELKALDPSVDIYEIG